jgi:hypothetical protein
MRLPDSGFAKHFLTFMFAGIPLVSLGTGIYFSQHDSSSSVWLWLLFFLPFFIHVIAWIFIHLERDHLVRWEAEHFEATPESAEIVANREAIEQFCIFFNVTMLVSVLLYCVPWITYSCVNSGNIPAILLSSFSYYCLVIIFIQFSIIALVTYIMMENPRKPEVFGFNVSQLKKGLELCAFWRIAHFFAIFMSISFVFGFAFAFHDLDYRKNTTRTSINPKKQFFENRALYVENLISSDDIREDKNKETKKEEVPVRRPADVTDGATPVCVYFKAGRAIFNDQDRNKELMRVQGKAVTDVEIRKDLARENYNFSAINTLVERFEENNEDMIRITLIGRADDLKPNTNSYYLSNSDLSEARINVVRSRIIDRLHTKSKTWQNIDWMPVPISNEVLENLDSLLSPDGGKPALKKTNCTDLEADPESGRRAVEVYFSKVTPDAAMRETTHARKILIEELEKEKYKTPSLMDYMYFSIYTITTTGYGDIKPATFYAKFLTSLENFFEVFFIVCFMNTLISLNKPGKSNPGIN